MLFCQCRAFPLPRSLSRYAPDVRLRRAVPSLTHGLALSAAGITADGLGEVRGDFGSGSEGGQSLTVRRRIQNHRRRSLSVPAPHSVKPQCPVWQNTPAPHPPGFHSRHRTMCPVLYVRPTRAGAPYRRRKKQAPLFNSGARIPSGNAGTETPAPPVRNTQPLRGLIPSPAHGDRQPDTARQTSAIKK